MKLTGKEIGIGVYRADTFALDGNYRFEPALTLKEGESIELSYAGGKPHAYKVIGPKGDARQAGKVLSAG